MIKCLSKGLVPGLVLVIVLGFGAQADTSGRLDPDDNISPLDIAGIEHGHAANNKDRLIHTVLTYEPWENDLEGWSIGFLFNLDSDGTSERTVAVYADGNQELVAEMRTGGGRVVGNPSVFRPNQQSVQIAFPSRWLGRKAADGYQWKAFSDFERSEPPCSGESGGCSDYAPGRNTYLRHRR